MYIACLLYDISQITGVIPLSTLKSYYENKVPQGVIKHKTNEVKKLKGIFFLFVLFCSRFQIISASQLLCEFLL